MTTPTKWRPLVMFADGSVRPMPDGDGVDGAYLDMQEITTQFGGTFQRILNKRPLDTERMKTDIPTVLASGYIYVGFAPLAALTSDATWSIVRTKLNATGNPTDIDYLTGISWDNRATAGWPT